MTVSFMTPMETSSLLISFGATMPTTIVSSNKSLGASASATASSTRGRPLFRGLCNTTGGFVCCCVLCVLLSSCSSVHTLLLQCSRASPQHVLCEIAHLQRGGSLYGENGMPRSLRYSKERGLSFCAHNRMQRHSRSSHSKHMAQLHHGRNPRLRLAATIRPKSRVLAK